jgi:hypothetical protein
MAAQTLRGPGGETIIALEAHFGSADAWTIHEAVRAADAESLVLLDFTQVTTYEDFAVALLAPDMAAPGDVRIGVRGLGPHQRRLLEYFGVSPLALENPRRGDRLRGRDRSGEDRDEDESARPRPRA